MIEYTGKIEGVDVTVSFDGNGDVAFRCDLLNGSFSSEEKLEKAIKDTLLKARKNFSNPTAYTIERWGDGLVEVAVTAIIDEHSAWVKNQAGRREKFRLSYLYADKNEVTTLLERDKARKSESEKELAALTRWEPKP